jgi:hypothetical protein
MSFSVCFCSCSSACSFYDSFCAVGRMKYFALAFILLFSACATVERPYAPVAACSVQHNQGMRW